MTMVEKKPFEVVITWRQDKPDRAFGFDTMEMALEAFEGLQKGMETDGLFRMGYLDASFIVRASDILHMGVGPS